MAYVWQNLCDTRHWRIWICTQGAQGLIKVPATQRHTRLMHRGIRALILGPFTMLCFCSSSLGQTGLTRLGEFRVNDFTAGFQNGSSIAADGVGDFVIVWQGVGTDDADGGIYMRRFNADGSPRGLQE